MSSTASTRRDDYGPSRCRAWSLPAGAKYRGALGGAAAPRRLHPAASRDGGTHPADGDLGRTRGGPTDHGQRATPEAFRAGTSLAGRVRGPRPPRRRRVRQSPWRERLGDPGRLHPQDAEYRGRPWASAPPLAFLGYHLDPGPPARGCRRAHPPAGRGDLRDKTRYESAFGSVKANVVSPGGPSSSTMVPACASTSPRVIANPSPVPSPAVGGPFTNRLKSRSRMAGGTPGPRSMTRIVTRPGSCRSVRTWIGVPGGA